MWRVEGLRGDRQWARAGVALSGVASWAPVPALEDLSTLPAGHRDQSPSPHMARASQKHGGLQTTQLPLQTLQWVSSSSHLQNTLSFKSFLFSMPGEYLKSKISKIQTSEALTWCCKWKIPCWHHVTSLSQNPGTLEKLYSYLQATHKVCMKYTRF